MNKPPTHTQFKSGKQAAEKGRKGGSVKSNKKKYAAKIRELKKKGYKNPDIKWLFERLTDPEANMLQIYETLEQIRKTPMNNHEKTRYVNTAIKAHQAHFGNKQRVQMDVETKQTLTAEDFAKAYQEANNEQKTEP